MLLNPQALVIATISIAFPARLLLLLLLLSPPCRGATQRIESPLVLADSTQQPIALTAYRFNQSGARLRVCGVVEGERIIVSEQMLEVLSVSTVKLRALELPKFIVHHALFEEIKIDLPHILYRVIGRPRRGRTGLSRRGRPRCGRAASLSGLPLSASSLLRISLCFASASAN